MIVRVSWMLAAALLGIAALWFGVIRDRQKPPAEQPKTTAEKLVGSWKKIRPENPAAQELFEIGYHFTEDGKYELRVWDAISGSKAIAGTYRLDGNILHFFTPSVATPSPSPHEIWELTNTIESLTEEELVIVTVTKMQWTPEMAQKLAEIREVPVDSLLTEVREDRSQTVYARVR